MRLELRLIVLAVITVNLFVENQGRTFHVVDLTYGFDENSIGYPGGQPFTWTKKRTGHLGDTTYYANDFHVAEHWGTHMDAQNHFKKDGLPMDKMPVRQFFAIGILINATSETGTNASYVLPVHKLMEWESINGEIPEHSVVFINFGWGKKFYHDRKHYIGPSEDKLAFPTISAEAAKWILDTKRVIGLAVDTASPDPPFRADAHVMFSENQIYIMENVNLTAPLPAKFNMVALPMKLVDGTGGPTRVVAMYYD